MSEKILIITDNLPDQINGVVTTFSNIKKLAERDGYQVFNIDPRGFRYINAPGYPEVKLTLPWGIGRRIREIAPDYIHIATEGPLGLAARLWCDWNGLRYNTSYHTRFPEFLKKIYGIPEFLTYRYVRWFHKHSGRVLTTTRTMVKELEDQGFRSDIISWTRGVDRKIFCQGLRTTTDGYLLSVGRVSREKGLDDFCNLPWPGRKVVVGDGPYRKELERRYPNIEFVGSKRGEELARYYANASVFVFTSRTDTFGVVIIEALAMGTPVAAYSVPGPVDIIETGVNGYMSEDLLDNVNRCSLLDRSLVEKSSSKWTWENCWQIFKNNLIDSGL